MKELSIEQKAKRYDDRLKKTKKWYDANTNEGYRGIFEDIFPELAEFENERIRGAIIDHLKDNNLTEWAAWLEAQGEKDEEILILKDQIESLHAAIKALKEAHKIELEKQGKQKPADNIQINPSDYINDMGGNGCYLKNTTQKPAWSKEDDYVIERLFCLLHNEQDKYPQQSNEFQELEEIGNKLISFKERIQPKQEWSEEDEQYLLVCKNALTKYQTTDKWDAHIISHWLEDKLKSLRPQNTWKPSKEEMVALEHAINCYSSISPTNTNEVFILEIMKERLKNLTK